ncbi:MAG: DNA-binding response regulator [Spirochaetaceae bacterium 4572_59]|nr:MAG: DNA-binding response regulator [Spirochaetaceae bacterium 4572_59]
MIRVLLVDDQVLFVETLKTVIEIRSDDIEIVGLAYNGKEAIEKAENLQPDIILMDVRMPELDGVQAAIRIHKKQPDIRIMMLTTFDDDDYVHDALAGGAVGYLLKNMPSSDLMNSIRAVNNGILQISPAVASQLVKKKDSLPEEESTLARTNEEIINYDIEKLSRREREILYLMSRGYDNSAIGVKLFIADQTVKNHISRIYHKLKIHDRMSAMKAARNSELKEYCHYLLDE